MGKLTIGSLFSGVGGLELGLEMTNGFKTLWQCENDPYARKILKQHWPEAKLYGDIRRLDGRKAKKVDLICGGSPCQDLSCAGKRAGLGGERSGLFYEMARVAGEARPKYLLMENSPELAGYMGRVDAELRARGYIAQRPLLVKASDLGAWHRRERIFVLAVAQEHAERSGLRDSGTASEWWRRPGGGEAQLSHPGGGEHDGLPDRERREALSQAWPGGEGTLLDRLRGRNLGGIWSCDPGDLPDADRGGRGKNIRGIQAGEQDSPRGRKNISDATGPLQGHTDDGDASAVEDAEEVSEVCDPLRRRRDGQPRRRPGAKPPDGRARTELAGGKANRRNGVESALTDMGGIFNGISSELDKIINTKTHLWVSGGNDAAQTKTHQEKMLLLRETDAEKDLQWPTGGLFRIQAQEVLRQILHVPSVYERKSNGSDTRMESEKVQEGNMRDMRNEKETKYTSSEWKHYGQFFCELDDIVRILSYEMALEQWESIVEKTFGVRSLRIIFGEIEARHVPKTLSEIQKIWKSLSIEDKRGVVLCAQGGYGLDIWPGTPITKAKVPDRKDRLKCLGNAVVPQVGEYVGYLVLAYDAELRRGMV